MTHTAACSVGLGDITVVLQHVNEVKCEPFIEISIHNSICDGRQVYVTHSSTHTQHTHTQTHKKTHYVHQVMKPPFFCTNNFHISNAVIFKYILSGYSKSLPLP